MTFHQPDFCVETGTNSSRQRNSCTEKRNTSSLPRDTYFETGISIPTLSRTKTSNKDLLDSILKTYENRETSSENIYEPCNETSPAPTTLTTSMEDNYFQYVINKIVKHKKTPNETLYCERWYEYYANYDISGPEPHIPAHFVTRYWRSKATKPSRNTSRRGWRIEN